MKSTRVMHIVVLGLLGGLSGWTLMQSGFHVLDALTVIGLPSLNTALLNKFIYEGPIVGLGLGMILQARVSLWYHHELVQILSKMLFGAFIGAILGLFCFGIGQFLQAWLVLPTLSRLTSWTLLGLLIVGATELYRSHSGFLWPRIISGGIGGAVGGGIFEILLLYQMTGPDHIFAIIVTGFSISFFIGITEDHVTSVALRILSGKQEGQIFLLDQNRFTLGYGSQNDLILKGYAEVCNLHAYIYKKGKSVIVENADAGGEVLVNYRLVDQQSMKKGDVIKIGTALLQYYEI